MKIKKSVRTNDTRVREAPDGVLETTPNLSDVLQLVHMFTAAPTQLLIYIHIYFARRLLFPFNK